MSFQCNWLLEKAQNKRPPANKLEIRYFIIDFSIFFSYNSSQIKDLSLVNDGVNQIIFCNFVMFFGEISP